MFPLFFRQAQSCSIDSSRTPGRWLASGTAHWPRIGNAIFPTRRYVVDHITPIATHLSRRLRRFRFLPASLRSRRWDRLERPSCRVRTCTPLKTNTFTQVHGAPRFHSPSMEKLIASRFHSPRPGFIPPVSFPRVPVSFPSSRNRMPGVDHSQHIETYQVWCPRDPEPRLQLRMVSPEPRPLI